MTRIKDLTTRTDRTEKYGFGASILNISVPIFLSLDSSVIRVVQLIRGLQQITGLKNFAPHAGLDCLF